MAWSTPKTWTSEPLTSADMNQEIRDNLNALKDPPEDFYTFNEASDLSFSSTSWATLVADTEFGLTTYGGDLFFWAVIPCSQSAGIAYFDIDVNGTRQGGDDGIARTAGTGGQTVTIFWRIPALAAGAHTIKLFCKVSAGTLTVYRGAGAAGSNLYGQAGVREIS